MIRSLNIPNNKSAPSLPKDAAIMKDSVLNKFISDIIGKEKKVGKSAKMITQNGIACGFRLATTSPLRKKLFCVFSDENDFSLFFLKKNIIPSKKKKVKPANFTQGL